MREMLKEMLKISVREEWEGIIIVGTVLALGLTVEYFKVKAYKSFMLKQKHKQEVISYMDKDYNGLSSLENYMIKELMGVQDSSKTYIPTNEDWERAYKKINNSLEGVLK